MASPDPPRLPRIKSIKSFTFPSPPSTNYLLTSPHLLQDCVVTIACRTSLVSEMSSSPSSTNSLPRALSETSLSNIPSVSMPNPNRSSPSPMSRPQPIIIGRPAPSDSAVFLPLTPASEKHPAHLLKPSLTSLKESKVEDLEKNSDDPLPPKRRNRILRHARHTFLNVYRRLFSFVFIANMAGLGGLLSRDHHWTKSPPLSGFATAAAANILVALLIRQDYIVNLLFKITWFVPLSAPLRLRRMLAKVYEYGGVHSGAAMCSVVWFSLLTGFLTNEYVRGHVAPDPAAILVFTYLLVVLLFVLCVTAFPRFRFSSHNTFENVHRLGGWSALAIFWVEIVLFVRTKLSTTSDSLGLLLIQEPAFWFLLVASLHTIAPWLRLHKMPVEAEKLSDHAIRLHFKEKVPLFVGLRISDAPLKEWHSFASIPSRDGGKSGGSVLISAAGDWTRKTIANPQTSYYVKGVPVTGVLCMAQIFRRVVIVTTGSGIGPCLGVMQDIPSTSCRVIWSTPNPLKTYGEDICSAVRDVDPDARVWDTKVSGRPDLVKMAYDLYCESDAEAVFVISNPKLTRKLVYGLESRGIPAFGPIWDS